MMTTTTEITKKKTRGGSGRNQGRKSLFKEKTKGVKFMCPLSKVEELKEYVSLKLLEWLKSDL